MKRRIQLNVVPKNSCESVHEETPATELAMPRTGRLFVGKYGPRANHSEIQHLFDQLTSLTKDTGDAFVLLSPDVSLEVYDLGDSVETDAYKSQPSQAW